VVVVVVVVVVVEEEEEVVVVVLAGPTVMECMEIAWMAHRQTPTLLSCSVAPKPLSQGCTER
jgi:hypothetical protein